MAPHAFVDANAFYSREDRALNIGYFQAESKTKPHFVFTCLSHDIVVHETTHAVLDGLRVGFMNLSGPDQAAFHEGFSDVVALLSIFSLNDVVELALTKVDTKGKGTVAKRKGKSLIHGSALTENSLADGALMDVAERPARH